MSTSASLDASYVDHVARLERRLGSDTALRHAVGGEFIAIGKLEYHLLRSRGLQDGHLVVDVGCGSGRLACQLAPFPGLRYIGCDIVPRLLDHARELCPRPDWTFAPASGTTLPCPDDQADFVCFFSVFTHLHQEEIYRYLREAHRVLKPSGLLLMSFLEFRVPSHWATFIASVDGKREDEHLNQFIERDSIRAWAAAAGFEVRSLHRGDTDYIPLPEEVRYENGATATGAASLGQSLAVLQKRHVAATGNPATPDLASSTPHPTSASPPPATAYPGHAAELINISTRAHVSAGHSATIGFILRGSASRRVFLRAVGPSLRVFGVPRPLSDPLLEIYSGEETPVASAGAWAGAAEIAAAAAAVGTFALPAESADAALLLSLPPGSHTASVKSRSGVDSGDVLVEVYLA